MILDIWLTVVDTRHPVVRGPIHPLTGSEILSKTHRSIEGWWKGSRIRKGEEKEASSKIQVGCFGGFRPSARYQTIECNRFPGCWQALAGPGMPWQQSGQGGRADRLGLLNCLHSISCLFRFPQGSGSAYILRVSHRLRSCQGTTPCAPVMFVAKWLNMPQRSFCLIQAAVTRSQPLVGLKDRSEDRCQNRYGKLNIASTAQVPTLEVILKSGIGRAGRS